MTAPRMVAVTSTGQMSGAERVLVRVLSAATERGWQVACAAPAGVLGEELSAMRVRQVVLPELGLAMGPRPVAIARTVRRWVQAARLVRRATADADIVLVNALTALPVVRMARLRPPAVWLAHDVVVRPDRLRLFRLCRPGLRRVIAVSEAVADRLRGGPLRVDVVHNGVPWPVDLAPPQGPEQPVVGISALLTPWKGHSVLLDAVPMLPAGVSVELMGGHLPKDSDFAASIAGRAAELSDGRDVRMLGHVTDPLPRMRMWSVTVSTSVEPEASGLSVLESMSIGVPVVATNIGGVTEVLDGAGILVPPGDPRALADAISLLLSDASLRAQCVAKGLDRVSTAHRLDRQTDALLDLLAETAGVPAR